ncbi:MAG: hypothetical protein ABI624_16670 [Casimicrobiaceae bacterium]
MGLMNRLFGALRRTEATPPPRREPVRVLPRAMREPPPAPRRVLPAGALGLVFSRDDAALDDDGRILVKTGVLDAAAAERTKA